MSTLSIDVQLINESSFNSVIVIFANDYPVPLTQEILQMAWRVMLIPSKGSAVFPFSIASKIGAFYHDNHVCTTAGPVEASTGTTWSVTADRKSSELSIKQNGLLIDTSLRMYVYMIIRLTHTLK